MTLSSSDASMASSLNSTPGQCDLCLLRPEYPVRLACNHVLCRDCRNVALERALSCRCPVCEKSAVERVSARDSLADIEIELERLKQEKEKLLSSKQREIKKMALEFLTECRNQKLVKLDRLKAELKEVQQEIYSMTCASHNEGESNHEDEVDLSSKNTESDSVKFLKTEEISNCHANMLKNFPDLENNYFFNSKYESIGQLIYNAFRYESFTDLAQIAVAETPTNRTFIYGMSASSSGLLSVAGTLKTVNVYNPAIEDHPLPIIYPITKLPANSFTWSTSWNAMSPNLLAVGDYNSEVKIWDVVGRVATSTFPGHTASKYLNVSWVPTKPQQLLSVAYDSAEIKMWRSNERGCVLNITVPNKLLMLCCKPLSPYHFAVSSIDRKIYSYDIRKPDKPVNAISGHTKTVFHLKFLDTKTLISASVDGTLKQWTYDSGQCLRTYKGHQSSVKFIGLDVVGEHIVCGSEDNALFLYHEALSKPVMRHQLPASTSLLGNPAGDQEERHVTSVVVVGEKLCAANDAGVIHILTLSEDKKLKHVSTQC